MKQRTVLVDMLRLGNPSGFGEIARNFGQRLAQTDCNGLQFVFLVKKDKIGAFGDRVKYVAEETLDEDLRALGHDIDLWHATDQLPGIRRRRKGQVELLTVHDLNFLREKRGIHRIKSLWRFRRRVAKADCITVISDYVGNDLLDHVRLKDKPLERIYNGVRDLECDRQTRPAFLIDDRPFLFTIGQIREKKNFHRLVPMMRRLKDYRLYICGMPHHSFERQMRALLAAENLDNVHLTGEITDSERVWMFAHCSAFVFPSRLEGFGLPPLEAMRFGSRVIASRYSCLPEICRNHAAYFPSMDPDEMAECVRAELASWQRDGEQAKSAAEYSRSFNYDKYTDAYINLYRRLLGI